MSDLNGASTGSSLQTLEPVYWLVHIILKKNSFSIPSHKWMTFHKVFKLVHYILID